MPQSTEKTRPTLSVSVAITVLNEEATLPAFIPTLLEQTYPPAEIVICDGGSSDNTLAILEKLQDGSRNSNAPIRLLSRCGANISEGRNAAIRESRHDFIAVTDSGIRLERDWLEQLVLIMEEGLADPDVKGVAGFFLPEVVGSFETALAGTTMPFRHDVDAKDFLPAGRSMLFRREAWEEVEGFPEWLDYCEDLVFDHQLEHLAQGRRRALPMAEFSIVRVRPRPNIRSFYKQYFLYARGDGKADLWGKRHLVRYIAYLLLLPLLVVLISNASRRKRRWGRLLALLAGFTYCRRPIVRVWKLGRYRLSSWALAGALLQIPLIRLVGDIAKMLGYFQGWRWRVRNWARPEIHWRMKMRIRSEDKRHHNV